MLGTRPLASYVLAAFPLSGPSGDTSANAPQALATSDAAGVIIPNVLQQAIASTSATVLSIIPNVLIDPGPAVITALAADAYPNAPATIYTVVATPVARGIIPEVSARNNLQAEAIAIARVEVLGVLERAWVWALALPQMTSAPILSTPVFTQASSMLTDSVRTTRVATATAIAGKFIHVLDASVAALATAQDLAPRLGARATPALVQALAAVIRSARDVELGRATSTAFVQSIHRLSSLLENAGVTVVVNEVSDEAGRIILPARATSIARSSLRHAVPDLLGTDAVAIALDGVGGIRQPVLRAITITAAVRSYTDRTPSLVPVVVTVDARDPVGRIRIPVLADYPFALASMLEREPGGIARPALGIGVARAPGLQHSGIPQISILASAAELPNIFEQEIAPAVAYVVTPELFDTPVTAEPAWVTALAANISAGPLFSLDGRILRVSITATASRVKTLRSRQSKFRLN